MFFHHNMNNMHLVSLHLLHVTTKCNQGKLSPLLTDSVNTYFGLWALRLARWHMD